jgi:hypothetical protein
MGIFLNSMLGKEVKRKRKHRAGWQVALRKRNNLSTPYILSTNVRSLVNKHSELKNLVQSNISMNVSAIMIQETWLSKEIPSELINIDGYYAIRCDRNSVSRRKGGGVLTYVSNSWCNSPRILFTFSNSYINFLSISCKPRFLSQFSSVILSNIYVAPDCPLNVLNEFAELFTTKLNHHISESLFILCGDLNHTNLDFLFALRVTNIVNFSTRYHAQLDYVFLNTPKNYSVKKLAPLSTSDHCILRVLPTVYSKVAHRDLLKSLYRKTRRRVINDTTTLKLQDMIATTDFTIFDSPSISEQCDATMSYLKFCFDVCCPIETILIRPDRYSSPHLKQLRRKKRTLISNIKELR